MKYVVYLDESYSTDSRFSSIAACSIPASEWSNVIEDLLGNIASSGITELKWQKLKNAKHGFAARKTLDLVLTKFVARGMRVDVLVWDNHDSRNRIMGRDDAKNFERMFFHLLSTSMTKREKGAVWGVYPDERSGIDWDTAIRCLDSVGSKKSPQDDILYSKIANNSHFKIQKFLQAESSSKPLVQVADLFAGLAAFSVLKYDQYAEWEQENHRNMDMFSVPGQFNHSKGDVERFSLLRYFDEQCKERSLGVSLRSEKGLRTRDPKRPINFWRYIPQGAYDKAPVRGLKA